jgi:hypothetical protein
MVITIVVDHPLDVPLSPAHLLFFLAFPFPFKPALHPKARAKARGLALKGDFIDRLDLVIHRFFVLLYRCSQIGKVAQRLVPPLLGTVCSRLLPLLALLLSEARQGEPALRPLLSFLLRHLLHRTVSDPRQVRTPTPFIQVRRIIASGDSSGYLVSSPALNWSQSCSSRDEDGMFQR